MYLFSGIGLAQIGSWSIFELPSTILVHGERFIIDARIRDAANRSITHLTPLPSGVSRRVPRVTYVVRPLCRFKIPHARVFRSNAGVVEYGDAVR